MQFDFSDFNFKIINIIQSTRADLTVNKQGINISRKVAEDLGYPPYIKMMFDAEKKIFAIQACKESDPNAIKFSKPKGEQLGGITFFNISIMNILRTVMRDKWDNKHRYQIPAKIFADSKIAVFYLEDFTEHELYNVKLMYSKPCEKAK